jgi:hypothetical protein
MQSLTRTLLATLLVASALPTASAVAAGPSARIRVDQAGYSVEQSKVAWLLAPRVKPGQVFHVEKRDGTVAFTGTAGVSTGRWNDAYRAVQPLDFSDLQGPGEYRIVVPAEPPVHSPWFQIGSTSQVVDPLIGDVVTFFQAQRDGPDVIAGDLGRKPSHLNDATAALYAWPTYPDPDSDAIDGDLVPLGGTTDLAGGWFDAGDFIKFSHTTAYADALLWAAQRELGTAAPTTLIPEARFGLDWLTKAWHPGTGVVDLQVGIGSGNLQGTYAGDHDVWRLPETDDGLSGDANRYLSHRPAFAANAAGSPVPPNLAGRMAAAFALAAQVTAPTDRAGAIDLMDIGAQIFDAAKTQDVQEADVVTALPHAFYPESSWRDDLAWGAAELALAGQTLGDPRADTWLASGAHWAAEYLATEAGGDTLNLYDTSAIAMADLVRAIRATGTASSGITEQALLDGIRAQLDGAMARAAKDPFGVGVEYAGFDAAPHVFGLIATARLYRLLTGDDRYDAFTAQQRDWAFGANPWGVSLMIGAGTTFPRCPQHVVANLSGRQDGTAPILRGAVVNGPNSADLFADGLDEFFDEGHACPTDGKDRYAAFTGHGSRFVDDVSAWQTVEPALDFSGIAGYALALTR